MCLKNHYPQVVTQNVRISLCTSIHTKGQPFMMTMMTESFVISMMRDSARFKCLPHGSVSIFTTRDLHLVTQFYS